MFRATVLRAGGEPDRAIMVGDSITDIRTARAANVPVVAVDFGYTDVPIATLGPGPGHQLLRGTARRPSRLSGTVKNAMDDQAFIGQED